jgi:hypothetical protein
MIFNLGDFILQPSDLILDRFKIWFFHYSSFPVSLAAAEIILIDSLSPNLQISHVCQAIRKFAGKYIKDKGVADKPLVMNQTS